MANRTYEVMYIADPETAAENIAKINEGIESITTAEGGSIVRTDDIGRRKMAYIINKKREGYYVLHELEGSGREIAEIERRFRVNDAVLRFITVRVDEERKSAEKRRTKRDNRTSRRASFRQTQDETGEQTAANDQ